MNTLNSTLQPHNDARPWYKESYVWLVVGGPLVVVVASILTFVIAVKNPDPVLSRQPAAAEELGDLEKLKPEERAALELSRMPALNARNHVKTPNVPKEQ